MTGGDRWLYEGHRMTGGDVWMCDIPLNPVPEEAREAARRLVLRLTSGSPGWSETVLQALGLDDEETT